MSKMRKSKADTKSKVRIHGVDWQGARNILKQYTEWDEEFYNHPMTTFYLNDNPVAVYNNKTAKLEILT